jgi:methylmalonyl-CoA/ethylmalonyl-CoA epimerase
VDDVVATATGVAAKGVRVLGESGETRNVHGERIAFVHPKDFYGALVELEEHHTR